MSETQDRAAPANASVKRETPARAPKKAVLGRNGVTRSKLKTMSSK
jgi:hypothetical protein